jgi:anhydro-N-acetylmuramic acid kinase
MTLPYEPALRERIRACLGGAADTQDAERALTEAHAVAVERLLSENAIAVNTVGVVGFHGHTILHRPDRRRTWQIGDGALLARLIGIDVVSDFRSADVAAGGQGAPLVPLYHAALAANLARPLAVLNLGGVANVTWLGPGDEVIAFDTGPGNALIDDWMRQHTGQALDAGGETALSGQIRTDILAAMLDNPWFDANPPKALDRDDFTLAPARGLALADGAATLTEFTAAAVALAGQHFPAAVRRWLVAGGGRHNRALMTALRRRLVAAVDAVEKVGWNGDALEAEAFAFLAVRSLAGLPLSLPSTTGVPKPSTGGRLFNARRSDRDAS